MMNFSAMTTTEKKVPVIDREQTKRFYEFRTRYINKNQNEAATILGVAQPYLSMIEAGKRAPGHKFIKKLIKDYKLNEEWWNTGVGSPKKGIPVDKAASLKKTFDLMGEIELMQRAMLIMEKNQAHFIKVMENRMKTIDILQKQVDELKRKVGN